MRIKKLSVLMLFIWSLTCSAAEIPEPEGVSIELDDNRFVRLRAVGESKLLIGDRSDVQRGIKVATLKAKASIARYLSEDINTEEVLTQTAESTQSSNGKVTGISRSDAEKLTETIKNTSSELLKGIVVLEQIVDPENQRVLVTVGTSENTQKAAGLLKKAFNHDAIFFNGLLPSLEQSTPVHPAESETRRNAYYDEF